MTQSRRKFLSTSSLALAGLLSGCALGPWQVYSGFNPAQHLALEAILTQDDDDHSQIDHRLEIESKLVAVYAQHPTRDRHYAATGLHLTDGIILTVDHVIDDTILVDQSRRHVIERDHRERRITGVLARHPQYDLALIQTEDPEFLEPAHIHIGNVNINERLTVLTYRHNRSTYSRTRVLSNNHTARTTDGIRRIDMFRIHRNYPYGWSGSAVISRQTGHLIGLVSSSPANEQREYTSCSKVSHLSRITR